MLFPSPTHTLTALVGLVWAISPSLAELTITQPTASHWWVGQSLNTLAWSGTTPTEFTVLLTHPDVNILTDRLAIEAIVPTYIYSKSINPGQAKPAQGYKLQLANPLNSSDIYATSEAFEIKPVNSPYPSQLTPTSASSSNSTSAAVASGSSASASASGANANANTSTSSKSSAEATTFANGLVGMMAFIGGAVVLDGLVGMF